MAGQPYLGYRLVLNPTRPPAGLIEALQGWPTGNICDALGRVGAMDYRIKPLNPGWRFVGPAVTVRARPVDNLIIYKALEIARPGDVLVIAADGVTTCSVLGDLVCAIARARGVAALVTDGVVRDAAGIREVGVPVFARGLNPNSPWKDGPGDINLPVSCGGVAVHPGDAVAGDEDGVVVVPQAALPAVVAALPGIRAREAQIAQDIAAGRLTPAAVAQALAARSWQVVEGEGGDDAGP
ncbi:MAG: RraA family protein [Anaerolineae bacterium]|nr:RraA family protein [Anaerolineae bacterium]